MGTCNLFCIVKGGEYKLAKYSQHGGYPGGNGLEILEWMLGVQAKGKDNALLFLRLHNAANNVVGFTFEQRRQLWAIHAASTPEDVCEVLWNKRYPGFTRDTGPAELLDLLTTRKANTHGVPVMSDVNFAGDSLMCEAVFVIDLDKDTYEVYTGFNTEPLQPTERFASLPLRPTDGLPREYYQCKLLRRFGLKVLPTVEEYRASFSDEDWG